MRLRKASTKEVEGGGGRKERGRRKRRGMGKERNARFLATAHTSVPSLSWCNPLRSISPSQKWAYWTSSSLTAAQV